MSEGDDRDAAVELRGLREELARLRRENAELSSRHAPQGQVGPGAAGFELVVAKLAAGVVVQGADGQILTCNDAAERILGLSADQMAGRTSMDPAWRAVHPDGSPFPGETHPAMRSLQTGRAQRDVTMGVHKPDGTLTWILVNAQPLFESGERAPHAVVASFSDVTGHMEAEERARRNAEDLHFALDSAKMGIWEWSVATGEVRWSEQVERIFGMAPGSFPGTYGAYASRLHPEDRAGVEAAIRRAMDDTEVGDNYFVEHRVVRPDGVVRFVEAAGRVSRDEQGTPVRMAGTVLDVSAKKSLEGQLVRAQRMETVGRLAGGVAHDFNNLLTAIMGCVEIARTARSPQEAEGALESIQQASEQAGRLTGQLLTFARKRAFDLEVFDLGQLVRGTERLLSRVLGEDVEIRTGIAPQPLPIRADRTQIEQVLVNLAVNAREAMPGGGVLDILVGERGPEGEEVGTAGAAGAAGAASAPDGPGPGRFAVLEVRDTGEGIDPAVLPSIFDPFFTTKEMGTGLGLATCYGIVAQLGGQIGVDSPRGGPTSFTIHLPLTGEAQPTTTARATQVKALPGKGRILLVEDDAMVRGTAEVGLRAAGYEVVGTANGPQALALLRAQPSGFDLLLTDVVMPKMTGYELAEKARALQRQLPVLFVTGFAADALEGVADRAAAREAPHLYKPYGVAELLLAVQRVLPAPPG